ncbi:hypothetical protein P7K49_001597 [Saguinus oedipus]|uniref:Uncharacterized protein n=1 Tax=Saguinus oedipus TaxID=9490 RepID=A0ABQ9WEY8_SAGOE|nr:hypothetical protein P7K49_001597 [Saguinus oedipus]
MDLGLQQALTGMAPPEDTAMHVPAGSVASHLGTTSRSYLYFTTATLALCLVFTVATIMVLVVQRTKLGRHKKQHIEAETNGTASNGTECCRAKEKSFLLEMKEGFAKELGKKVRPPRIRTKQAFQVYVPGKLMNLMTVARHFYADIFPSAFAHHANQWSCLADSIPNPPDNIPLKGVSSPKEHFNPKLPSTGTLTKTLPALYQLCDFLSTRCPQPLAFMSQKSTPCYQAQDQKGPLGEATCLSLNEVK